MADDIEVAPIEVEVTVTPIEVSIDVDVPAVIDVEVSPDQAAIAVNVEAPAEIAVEVPQLPPAVVVEPIQAYKGETGDPGQNGGFRTVTIKRPITAQMVLDKGLTLPSTPADPAEVFVNVFSGIPQEPGVDYLVVGSFLGWNALALELLVSEGSVISIMYTTA